MLKLIGHRFLQMAFVFWLFLTLLFFMLHASPQDVTHSLALDPNLPREAQRIMMEQLGLDRPLHEQYFLYLRNFLVGNLGFSFNHYPREVIDILIERTPRTLFLFLTATLVAYWAGFVVGKILAWHRGGLFEYGATVVGVLLYTVFLPWFALMMIWLFSFILGWFPIRGFVTPSLWLGAPFRVNTVFNYMLISVTVLSAAMLGVVALSKRAMEPRVAQAIVYGGGGLLFAVFLGFWGLSPMRPFALNITFHTMLPVLTLRLAAFGGVMLLTRSSMLETLREDYILTARAKGLPERIIRNRHAARNALLPVVTSLVIALAFVIGGGVITETIFSWPGIGLALLDAVLVGDVPLALGALAFLGILALIGHLVVDIVYMYLDPRIRY
jgi:peptide/nickel transport system permease protein